MTTELAVRQSTLAPTFSPTPEQYKMIRDTFASGCTEGEFRVLMEVAKARNLNPLLRQVWFVKRWDSQKKCEVWAVQVSIDGLRSIADRTGKYDGQDEPEFVEDGGKIKFCRVKVYRKDVPRPFVATAHFDEYAGKTRDGSLTQMWSGKPHIMIAKCAEALALRKAFPEDSAGLYVAEEMPESVPQSIEAAVAREAFREEKAKSRGEAIMARAEKAQEKPAKPWHLIMALFADAGYEDQKEVAERVKAITGKASSKELDAADVEKVRVALTPPQPPEPGAEG